MKIQLRLWHLLTLQIFLLASLVWAADSRITELTELTTGNLNGADVLAVVDTSDTTDNPAGSSRKTLLSSIKDFIESQFIATAGSATAGTWLKIESGTLQTTPDDNSVENDGNAFYLTTDAGNRGYVPVMHCIRADATRTFTSNTIAQNIFTSPANGRITLETGLYTVRGLLNITAMSATSGNGSINLLGGGSATVGAWLWHVVGVDGANATAAAQSGSTMITSTTPASAVTAGTGTVMSARVYGTFEITVAGTMQPQFTMVTASASVLSIGSHLCVERVGSTSVVSIGQWD